MGGKHTEAEAIKAVSTDGETATTTTPVGGRAGAGTPTAERAPGYVLPFGQIGARDLPRVGGKGANLGELTRAGFAVPPGFCVTTAAFDRFMDGGDGSDSGEGTGDDTREATGGEGGEAGKAPGRDDRAAVRDWVFATLAALAPADVEGVRVAGAAIRERLVNLPIPPDVAADVLDAWRSTGPEHAYAVRSSATAEDLPGASFAGQQDTYLNVRGEEALLDAVRRCWASLFTDRAILYRAQNAFDHRHVKLSVVVQRQVVPEVAGILFTADPLTGHRHVTTIDAGFGLGEALVSGIVSADLYRVDQRTDRIVGVQVGDKPIAIRALPEGGTYRETLPESMRRARVLTDHQVMVLARLGKRVAAHYGEPQDVEWCIDAAGGVFVVQARPITSLFPLPDPAPADGALHVYASFGHVQVMTDPMPAMGRSVLRTLLPFGKAGRPTDENPHLSTAGGRLYADLTPLLAFEPLRRRFPRGIGAGADALMGEALAEVVGRDEFLARAAASGTRRVRPTELAHFLGPIFARVLSWLWLRRPEDAVPWIGGYIDDVVADASTQLAAAPPGAPRVREAQRVIGGAFLTHLPRLVPVIAGGMLARLLLLRLTGDRAGVDALLRGFTGNATTEMDLEVGDLADLARGRPAVAAHLAGRPPAEALATLEAVEGGAEFLAGLRAFLDRYGMRGASEIDITRPRWREDPSPLIQVVVGNLRHEAAGVHRATHARQVQDGEAAAERLVARARAGWAGPLRAPIVRRLARVVRGLLAGREHPKFMIVRLFGLSKTALLEAGGGLVAAGRLDRVDDIWFLGLDELIRTLEDAASDPRATIAARRAEHARSFHLRPPRVITSDGEIPQVRHRRSDLPAGALPGSAASAGVAEGVAHVVRDPTTEVLAPGEILVAPFTDPGWTPLFINAAGLVMEVGGLMTHGSVVAREYGIPAVVGVLDATTAIRSGQRVRVNGDLGYVEVVDGES